ncbi:hypothetical protein, partial [Kingella kingae]|uniref:hypothetical protein n=1 Tax=Kingella kingae TaxID=504 RepID=UPI001E56F182
WLIQFIAYCLVDENKALCVKYGTLTKPLPIKFLPPNNRQVQYQKISLLNNIMLPGAISTLILTGN